MIEASQNNKRKKIIFILIPTVFFLIFASVFAYFAFKAQTDNIYDGISIAGVNVSFLSANDAEKKVADKLSVSKMNIPIKCGDFSVTVTSDQINLSFDAKKTAEKAAETGKNGSIFAKIKNMIYIKKHKVNIEPEFKCDTETLQKILNDNFYNAFADVRQYNVEIGENCIVVNNGQDGKTVEAVSVLKKISKAIYNNTIKNGVEADIKTVSPDPIDKDKFYEEYNREPVDAVCTETDGGVNITPEIIGISIDRQTADKIIDENRDTHENYTIPAVITYPAVTSAYLEAEFTDTVIGTYSSNYSTSTSNRKSNISLASAKINSVVLNPGDVFSFNNVVGPRTAETGFKEAHVYSGNKVVEGIGGGICQVSSTLYNAVVRADLEIVYRTNHSIPVSYVPIGCDATVSYGTIDFKFKNNKDTPVKIECIADGNNLTVNIYGRKKYLKDITVEAVKISTTDYVTTEVSDETLMPGERKVIEKGSPGSVYESYKITKVNGEVVSREFLAKSTYSPINEVVHVGAE